MQTRIHSTLGFLFSPDLSEVVLIEKLRPQAHKGQLNGLGGKVEPGESITECLIREVIEETGIQTDEEDWTQIGTLQFEEWDVEVFAGVVRQKEDIQNSGDEYVAWFPVRKLPAKMISNLTWLIPMCLDVIQNKKRFTVDVQYL